MDIASYSEFVKESASVFTYDEMKADIEALDHAMTKSEKEPIAAKYGIDSNKSGEIRKAIFLAGNEIHKSKKPSEYTNDDFKWWWMCFDAPTSSTTLKKALDGDSPEWCEFILAKAEELVFKGNRSDYWERARRSFVKYVGGLVNKAKNDSDANFVKLMEILMRETKEFHDDYIERVRKWSDRRFDVYSQFRKFDIYDFMCFFGTENRDYVADVYEGAQDPRRGVYEVYRRVKNGEKFSPVSRKYTLKVASVDIGISYPNIVEAVPIRKDVDYYQALQEGKNLRDRRMYSDVPSKYAISTKVETDMLAKKYGWGNKKKYVDDIVEEAEKQYQRDMLAIAEKIRRMNIDEELITVESIQDDPKRYDIFVSDGTKRVHARSIFAAEFSVKVTPHYRFIIT